MFFEYNAGVEFWSNDRLGPNMFLAFKTWLRDANLLTGDTPTQTCEKLLELGSDSLITWGVIWSNLAYASPLVNWFVRNLTLGVEYDNPALYISLGENYSKAVKDSAIKSIKETLKASPIGADWGMAMATCNQKGNSITSFYRNAWLEPEPIVILYSLYLFAEKMDGLYSFTLSDLYADDDSREAISPRIIFGIDKDEIKPILQGVANNYPEYITVDFNKGIMENIDLPAGKIGKTAVDVLSLI